MIPAKAEPIKLHVPLRRFRYDAKHDILKCPRGRILRPARPYKHGCFFYSRLCCEFVAIAKANAPQTLPRHGDRTLSASFLSLSIVALAF